jgi:TolB protein
VFLRFKPAAGPPTTPVPDAQVALFVENLDGTGLRQITPYFLSDRPSANWSPDGLKIITNMSNGAGGRANRLFVVDPNSGGVKQIHLQLGTQQYVAFQPVWSPDGTRILFNTFINGGNGLFTANANGSNVQQVTFTTDFTNFYNGPDWGTHPVQ